MRASGTPAILTEFIGHPLESQWDRAFLDARKFVQRERGIEVYELAEPTRGLREGLEVSALFRVVRVSEAANGETRSELAAQSQRQIVERIVLAVAAVGPPDLGASETILACIGRPPPGLSRWIDEVETIEDLRDLLARWLLLLVDRQFGEPRAVGTEAVLAAELSSTLEGAETERERRPFRGIS